jgi:hypothetical protein
MSIMKERTKNVIVGVIIFILVCISAGYMGNKEREDITNTLMWAKIDDAYENDSISYEEYQELIEIYQGDYDYGELSAYLNYLISINKKK